MKKSEEACAECGDACGTTAVKFEKHPYHLHCAIILIMRRCKGK